MACVMAWCLASHVATVSHRGSQNVQWANHAAHWPRSAWPQTPMKALFNDCPTWPS